MCPSQAGYDNTIALYPWQLLILSVFFFNFSHISLCVVVSHCDFNRHFQRTNKVEEILIDLLNI